MQLANYRQQLILFIIIIKHYCVENHHLNEKENHGMRVSIDDCDSNSDDLHINSMTD
jgi:hypothetical protein